MQNLKECGHERRGVMTEQNRSSFAVVPFYTTSALVTASGLAILITSATIAYMVAQSFKWCFILSIHQLAVPIAAAISLARPESFPAGARRASLRECKSVQKHSAQ